MLPVGIAWGALVDRELRLQLSEEDALELSQASAADQDRLIELFVRRHTAGEPLL